MAGNGAAVEDVESISVGARVQPFSLSSMSEQCKFEEGKCNTPTLNEILGFEELFSLNTWRASLAELIGVAIFVFALDTIVISSFETKIGAPKLVMSVLTTITTTVILLAINPVSGGHLNPAITISAALVGLISIPRAVIYILAQCVGGILGSLALKAVVNSTIEQTFSLGGCTLTVIAPGPNGPITVGLGTSQALWLEIICTFVLLFASIWMAFDYRQAKSLGRVKIFSIIGIVVGLLVFVSTTVTAAKGYAGAGMNPARCLGPAIVRGGHLWSGHWVFWVGPIIACVAFYLYVKLIPEQHFNSHAQGFKHEFVNIFKVLSAADRAHQR